MPRHDRSHHPGLDEDAGLPLPDFSVSHQCRDFDALVRYRDDNAVDLNKWLGMKKPEGVRQVPAPRQYYQIFRPQPSNGHSMQQDYHRHHQQWQVKAEETGWGLGTRATRCLIGFGM